ncbi:hypothetical protein EDD21DRAFT_393848 [Dissophora ornata]|nr:hypothetical protein EDD21DRAFT_393848 [Dissophora ornata]
MATPLRFVHENGQGHQQAVPSQFESERVDDIKSFINLQLYWESQIAAGGDAAIRAQQARDHLAKSQAPTDGDIDMVDEEGGTSSDAGHGNNPQNAINNNDNPTNGKVVKKRGPRGSYRRYTERQINDPLAYRLDNQLSLAKAARRVGMTHRTAATKLIVYLNDEQRRIPTRSLHKKRGPKPILGPEHTEFIIKHLEQAPRLYVVEVWEALCKEFDGLKISKSAVRDHIVGECRFSFKRVRNLVDRRNHPDVLEERKIWATEWKFREEEFMYRTVFVDEAGFNLQMNRRYGWSRKG